MAAPVWVEEYLRRHDLAQLAEAAMNDVVAARVDDPAAYLARHFASKSKNNGVIHALEAAPTLGQNGVPAVQVQVVGQVDGFVKVLGCGIAAQGRKQSTEMPVDLLDADSPLFGGRGVTKACAVVASTLAKKFKGKSCRNSADLDERLWEASESLTKHDIGANTMHSLSLAFARSAATADHCELWEVVRNRFNDDVAARRKKASDGVADTVDGTPDPNNSVAGGVLDGEAVRIPALMCTAITHSVQQGGPFRRILLMGRHDQPVAGEAFNISRVCMGLATALADAVKGSSHDGSLVVDMALDAAAAAIKAQVEAAGLVLGTDIRVVVDFGASRLYNNTAKSYTVVGVDAKLDIDAWLARIRACVTATPGVAAVIDPAGTDDYETWRKLREGWKGAPVILGDDLFDSNPHTVDQGTSEGWADGVVACLALTGTLKRVTDMAVVSASRQAKFVVRVSSGEVVDSNVADIAVGARCWAVVVGSPLDNMHAHKIARVQAIDTDARARKLLKPWVETPPSQ